MELHRPGRTYTVLVSSAGSSGVSPVSGCSGRSLRRDGGRHSRQHAQLRDDPAGRSRRPLTALPDHGCARHGTDAPRARSRRTYSDNGWPYPAQPYAAEKLFREAYKATERAHITGPQQIYHLGVLAERQDQTEEAEIFYLRAVTHHSESAGARDALIALAAQQGKSTEEVEQMIAAWREETVKEEGERLLAERSTSRRRIFRSKTSMGTSCR